MAVVVGGQGGVDRSRSSSCPLGVSLVAAGLIPQNSSLMGNQEQSKRSCGDLIRAAGGPDERRGRRSAIYRESAIYALPLTCKYTKLHLVCESAICSFLWSRSFKKLQETRFNSLPQCQ